MLDSFPDLDYFNHPDSFQFFTYSFRRSSSTAFNHLMSNIKLIPVFGTTFTVYMPIIMAFMAIMTLFNVFTRFMKIMGIESDDMDGNVCNELISCFTCSSKSVIKFTSPEELERVEAGKKLVQADLRVILQTSSVHSQSSVHSHSSGGGNGSAYNSPRLNYMPDRNGSAYNSPRDRNGIAETSTYRLKQPSLLLSSSNNSASNSPIRIGRKSSISIDNKIFEKKDYVGDVEGNLSKKNLLSADSSHGYEDNNHTKPLKTNVGSNSNRTLELMKGYALSTVNATTQVVTNVSEKTKNSYIWSKMGSLLGGSKTSDENSTSHSDSENVIKNDNNNSNNNDNDRDILVRSDSRKKIPLSLQDFNIDKDDSDEEENFYGGRYSKI